MRTFQIAAALGLLLASGCGGTGVPVPNDNGSPSTACTEQSADAQVSFDDDAATALTASAVTADCDEVVVYDDGQGVVIVSGSSTVQAEFDENGQLIAARTNDDETLSASYNDDLSYARLAYEDEDDNAASNIVEVSRDTAGAARAVTGAGTELSFCAQLRQFATLTGAGCDGDDAPPYCRGSFAAGRAAAERLCSAANITEVDTVSLTTAAGQSPTLPLGVSGYATTRPAAGSGTTIILASVAFGGTRPYTVRWTQATGAAAALSALPGGAAVVDAPTATGTYAFDVSVEDGSGATATNRVTVDLGETEFVGVVIQASPVEPAVGQTVTFQASGVPSTTTVLWDFGDGGRASGTQVTHTYTAAESYVVTVVEGSGANVLIDTLDIVVGGAGVARGPGFTVTLDVGDSMALAIGEQRPLRAVVQGAVGTPDVAIGVVGDLGVVELLNADIVDPLEGVAAVFGETAALEGRSEGAIVVAAVAVDAAGRVAEAAEVLVVCGSDTGLFAVIDAPLELGLGASIELDARVVSCANATPTVTYTWLVSGGATLSSPVAPAPTLTADMPGVIVVELTVSDENGTVARAATEILVTGGGDDLFIEYLGPFEVPVGVPASPSAFVGAGIEPFFCAWATDGTPGLRFTNPFSCDTTVVADVAGCYDAQLFVEDARGTVGATVFEICTGVGGGSPCPLDGFCDQSCAFVDPDCFESFCVPDDFVCDSFCGLEDSDCARCGLDNVCVLLCPQDDPDCQREFCVCGDGLCDDGCPNLDCDCSSATCVADGRCDAFCDPIDPDCSSTNAEICLESDFCCEDDGLCDGNCPQPDGDCQFCGTDGVCVELCAPADPDCSTDCDVTFDCDPNCPSDPDCDCDVTFDCDPNCPSDPDCFQDCDVTFDCDPNCPGDPDC